MKLARLAILYLSPPQKNWNNFKLVIKNCEVNAIYNDVSKENQQRILLTAETTLEYLPKVSGKNVLYVPKKERKDLESALNLTGNLIAISEFCSRNTKSPNPCIAFVPESQEESSFLDSTDGIECVQVARHDLRFSLHDIITKHHLNDRHKGCEFIATALSQDSAIGQLREYIRLFEHAFALSSNQLITALDIFLKGSDVIYPKDEINYWIIDLRDGSTHADRRNKLVFESKAQDYVMRMRQAAYDVLLNKVKWHDSSTTRRNRYIAPAGFCEGNTCYFVVNAPSITNLVRLRDQFDVFTLDLSMQFNSFPKEWNYWFKRHGGKPNDIKTALKPSFILPKTVKKTIHNRYGKDTTKNNLSKNKHE